MSTSQSDRTLAGPAMTEEVNALAGRVRVRGHLTRQGVDLLCGTVESLCRQGHARVVVDLAAVDAVDDGTLDALRALRRQDAGTGGAVVLLNAS